MKAVALFALTASASLLLVAGCGPKVVRTPEPSRQPPPDVSTIPDAVPRVEPRSSHGNPRFYDVLGKRYFVMASADGYRERGVASWYGPGFHAGRTASGEAYDMYGMTAAHKTLPVPCFAQVTNLKNGRSVIVRINDRGPFVANRLIDLSYSAASKLDMLREGTTLVEVRTVTGPEQPLPPPVVTKGDLYIQAGAFSDETNANRLLDAIRSAGIGPVFIREAAVNGRRLFRVRIGPVVDVTEFDRLVSNLRDAGMPDARLALD